MDVTIETVLLTKWTGCMLLPHFEITIEYELFTEATEGLFTEALICNRHT